MATATLARPVQALRNRRDAPRPSITKRQTTMDGLSEPSAAKKRKLDEPYVRTSQYILEKHNGKTPSLIIHLHPSHFRFEGQDGSFAYDSPMKILISHLKAQTVPHEIIEELLLPSIPWYDGCLIVEVHNHRAKQGKAKGRRDSGPSDGTVKFSMHNYNEHITPSPMVPFPSKARTDGTPEKSESGSAQMPAPERPKEKEGPSVTTIVLHPTELSKNAEILLLMKTPADQLRGKKRSGDATTPSSAQPPTPSLSVPPTPMTTSRGQLSQSQKMCLEENDLYSFQADLLVATEPRLYLEPVSNAQEHEKVLDLLRHPLHEARPPSPKTRKRTIAEVAADDAQAAEAERRMLLMDERIKPAGPGASANENQSAASSLGFSRFKTIEMVRERHEQLERVKKEEETRALMEKKQAEEQNALQQKQAQMAQRQREMAMLAQQQQQQQQQQQPGQQAMQQMRAAQQAMRAQQAMMNAQAHGHPHQNNMMSNAQQNFQQGNQVSMAQSSPVVRQQTPAMLNSSPMLPQGGFPMAQTSSQGAGSPPRPTSAALQNPMARQVSQQQGSRNNTPQMQQGTPGLNPAMPNRQITQTPRMQPGSPAAGMQQQGTPTSVSMAMQTPQITNANQQLTPEQMQILMQRNQNLANGSMQAGSSQASLTPEQFQNIQNMNKATLQFQSQQQASMMTVRQLQAQGNTQAAQNLYQEVNKRAQMFKLQMQQQQNAQMMGASGQAGSPGSVQQPTPQLGHAHPQQQQGNMQNTNQMQNITDAQAQAKAQQLAAMRAHAQSQQIQQAQSQIHALAQRYGNLSNIPPQVTQQLPLAVQQLIKSQSSRQQQLRQQQSMRAQALAQVGNGAREQVPGSQPNPQYMQHLRNNQAAMLAQMQNQQQQNQQGGMTTLGMQSFTVDGMGFAANGQGQNGSDLGPQFAAMQNALNRSGSAQGQGQGGMQ